MSRREIERSINGISERVGERVRHYADEASHSAHGLIERGRHASRRFGRNSRGYGEQLTRYAEDVADEANYQYRRLKRQVKRHPGASLAIAAGTVGAFLLLRRAFASRDDD